MPATDGYILDASLLAEVGRGDNDVIALLQALDAADVAIVVPALAVTGATVETAATNEQLAVMRGVGRLDSATFAALAAFDDTVDLGRMRLETDAPSQLWDVQTALQAVLRNCPILTTDAARWDAAEKELSGQLTVVEISQLDD